VLGLPLPAARLFEGRSDRLVENAADGAGAASAFGTTAEATIDFAGGTNRALAGHGPDLVVRDDVARTHDHGGAPSSDSSAFSHRERAGDPDRFYLPPGKPRGKRYRGPRNEIVLNCKAQRF